MGIKRTQGVSVLQISSEYWVSEYLQQISINVPEITVRREEKRRRMLHYLAKSEAPFPPPACKGKFMDGLEWISLVSKPTMPRVLLTGGSRQEALNYSNQGWRHWNKQVSAFSLVCKENNQNTATLPAKQPTQHKEDKAAIWFRKPFSFVPLHLLWRWSRQLAPPFMCAAVAVSLELPVISLSSRKNEGSLETRLSHTEISLSQWAVNAPIMLAF